MKIVETDREEISLRKIDKLTVSIESMMVSAN